MDINIISLISNAKAVNYYRYKSVVLDRLYELNTWNEKKTTKFKSELSFFEGMKAKLLADNPHIIWDNKVAIEYKTSNGGIFFVGCFDDKWAIGLSRSGDEWIKAIKLNEK